MYTPHSFITNIGKPSRQNRARKFCDFLLWGQGLLYPDMESLCKAALITAFKMPELVSQTIIKSKLIDGTPNKKCSFYYQS